MGRPRKPEHLKKPRAHPSGASKRRAKFELDALIDQQARDDAGAPPDDGKWVEDFRKAGKPDLTNPETDLDYTRKLQLIVLYQMATTPFPSRAQAAVWRSIREMSATVGMTSSRASLESTVKRLRKQLDERSQVGTVDERPVAGLAKPDTARGQRRGPRPLEPDPTEPTK